jgi:hypothetical protein
MYSPKHLRAFRFEIDQFFVRNRHVSAIVELVALYGIAALHGLTRLAIDCLHCDAISRGGIEHVEADALSLARCGSERYGTGDQRQA